MNRRSGTIRNPVVVAVAVVSSLLMHLAGLTVLAPTLRASADAEIFNAPLSTNVVPGGDQALVRVLDDPMPSSPQDVPEPDPVIVVDDQAPESATKRPDPQESNEEPKKRPKPRILHEEGRLMVDQELVEREEEPPALTVT